jgi:asparagine synthase (glutamine-hydrolysing)
MSFQFGQWNFDGEPADPALLKRVAGLGAKYCPDGETFRVIGPLLMLFQPVYTTPESRRERQPVVNPDGIALTWDGILDNRDEVARLLYLPVSSTRNDADLVLAAYAEWGTGCFSKFIGDWALTIWDPTSQWLLLAKDFVGTRSLFYALEARRVTWSTVLDPLLILSERTSAISEEFVAGYLGTFPATDCTPYTRIDAVPAATYLRIQFGNAHRQQYWRFEPSHRINYGGDSEYEEHFRHVFREAVRRRLRAFSPVLAELSGGIDSSSIVSMADDLLSKGRADTSRLDTISYYDDQDPDWDERPYFSLVEQIRGRQGHHVNVGVTEGAFLPPDDAALLPLPGSDRRALARIRMVGDCLHNSGGRVLLSGIGGDEFLGGVPTPIPELQDLFAGMHWFQLARQLFHSSIHQRRPVWYLGFETVEEFLPQTLRGLYKQPRIAPWLTQTFVRRNASSFWRDTQRTSLTGARPSFQANETTLNHVRRQLNCFHPYPTAPHVVRYPYLDRDLLTLLFAFPREQFVRPGQRRSLMRRALAGIVPPEILGRKRKAYVARHPLVLLDSALPTIEWLLDSSVLAASGWIDPTIFKICLRSLMQGWADYVVPMLATLKLELWLRDVVRGRRVAVVAPKDQVSRTKFNPKRLNAEKTRKGETNHVVQET